MTDKTKPSEDFRMSAREFDRMMGKALRVAPKDTKPKARKAAKKKKSAR